MLKKYFYTEIYCLNALTMQLNDPTFNRSLAFYNEHHGKNIHN